MRRFVAELRRRRVIRTTIIYAAVAWAAIQVVTTLLPVFGGREMVVRAVVALILAGLPVAVLLSWLFELTPGGLERDEMDTVGPLAPPPEPDAITRLPPTPSTPLLGRDAELTALTDLLVSGTRVVTVTGPGGTGKTRVAIAATERVRASFGDGVAYLELAAVTEPDAVVPTIAGALGVKEAESRTLAAGLATIIADRRVLLVLDNCEQVLAAAPALATLVSECPSLCLLCTSRGPLRISGEVEFPLRPLVLPPAGVVPPLEDLETFPAVALFLDRTRRARPDFQLTPERADAVLQICRRLDGLPLALELAAARLRTLEPTVLLEKLAHALDVLTAGARDLPARQRTLRATLDWSHSLLDEPERRLFRHLAVFAGGWPLEGVAPVCYDGSDDGWLDLLESLVEKGLVLRVEGSGRFNMLETIREYAAERLAESGTEPARRRRHAEYFGAFAEAMYADYRGVRQVESLAHTDAEGANVEEALAFWHAAALAGDTQAGAAGLAMCGDLWMYWHIRGLQLRARAWCERFLQLDHAVASPAVRARALLCASVASMTLGDVPSALQQAAEAEAIPDVHDPGLRSLLEISHGVAHLTAGAIAEAHPHLVEAVRRARTPGSRWELGMGLTFLGIAELAQGRAAPARAHFEEAIALQRTLEDHAGLGASLGGRAAHAAATGHPEKALALYREAFDAYHIVGDRPEEARILDAYAWTALSLERVSDARASFAESLRAYEEVGSVRGVGIALLGLAATEAAARHPDRAVRIAAAASRFAEQEGIANEYARVTSAPRYLEEARAALDPASVAQLELEGRALTVREAVRYALDTDAGVGVEQVA